MKAIAKNFNKFNQLVSEKFSNAAKHEVSDSFRLLEHQTEIRRTGAERILEASNTYLKTLEKRKEAADKQKYLAIESFGGALLAHGSELDEESKYGQALIKMGECEEKIGVAQVEFVSAVRASFVKTLEEYMAEMKQYKHLKGKLENRRLDYDGKLNRLQKAKKEKPELDEEMRVAQAKYEETLAETEQLMISLNDREQSQLDDLVRFLDAQASYYSKANELLLTLKSTILDSSVQGTRVRRPSMFGKLSSTNLSTPEQPRSHPTIAVVPPSSASLLGSESASSLHHQPPRQTSALSDTYPSSLVTDASRMSSRSLNQPPRKLVRAQFSFTAENNDELTMMKGDTIEVVQEIDQGWWVGELRGRRGLFPANYCEAIIEEPVAVPQAAPRRTQNSQPSLFAMAGPLTSNSQPQAQSEEQSQERSAVLVPKFSYLEGLDGASLRKSRDSMSKLDIQANNNDVVQVVPECQQCGCDKFAEHPFKPGQCNQCFHRH